MPRSHILTDSLREVRHSMGRFLSLLVLSALAVSFLAGLRTTAPDMERSADVYYDQLALMDVHVLSTLGLTDGDIAVLAKQPGIEKAEGGYTIDAIIPGRENDFIVKAVSLSEVGINRPKLVEGRLPESASECLVEPKLLSDLGILLGDSITLNTGTGSFEDALARKRFTVVGTANSPLYISVDRGSSSLGSGHVSAFILLPKSAFTMDAYTDGYLLAQGAAELYSYDEDYKALSEALVDRLEPLGDQRASLRHDQVVGEATEKLDDAQAEYDDAKRDADQELADGELELRDARRKLDDGWVEYRDGQSTYYRELADAERKLTDGESDILTAETVTLPDALKKLQDGERDYADGMTTLQEKQQEYQDGLQEYQDGLADYAEGYDQITAEAATYNESLEKLQSGERDYTDGVVDYSRGLDKIQDAGSQISQAELKLQEGLDALFAGSQALSAGQAQLGQQQGLYQGLSEHYLALATAMAQAGMVGPDPAALAGQVGAVMGAELATTGGLSAFHTAYVAPLSAVLSTQLAVATAAGSDEATLAPLTHALAGLPADGDALSAAFMVSPPDTITAFLTGYGTAKGTLDAMGGALSQGQKDLDDGANSLAWGQMEYDDGREKLQKAKKEFYDGVDELVPAGQDLKAARLELDDGWRQLRDGDREMDDAWGELSDAKRELNDAQITLEDGFQQLQDGRQELVDARKELDDGWSDYRQGVADLATAKQDLVDGKRTLADERVKGLEKIQDAKRELDDGELDYADGLREYQDGKREAEEKLADARNEINDARRKVSEIEHCKWYVLGRNTNMGYVSFQSDAERMGNLASVFPLIFFLVAALVCLTTMTRMVEENRVQIGGLKALGYGKWAISIKYVGYGLSASLMGGVLGLVVGCRLIPWIIYTAWTVLYTLGPLVVPFYPGISLLAVGAAVVTVVGSAFFTCLGTLSAVPATLMRPKTPKSGKRVLLERIPALWKRLSFTQKVTVRNLFRYQRRFWMTVIGIGGCTALIITGFGLRDSIFSVMTKQYGEIYRYHTQIGLVDDVTQDELRELSAVLDSDENVTAHLLSRQISLSAETDRRSVDAYLFTVPDAEKFKDFVQLKHRQGGAPVVLPDDGAVLTEKLASLLGVSVGDTITLSGDRRVTVRVADITENYIMHYVYLSDAYYKSLYGAPPVGNVVLARYAEDSPARADAVSTRLIPLSGVTAVNRMADTKDSYMKSMESVDYAVVVVIISAAALAFVVLFNLTNINITERLRELATLKVLGFNDREMEAYVFRENALLTVFGVLMGLVMGKFLHKWLVLTVEIDRLMFGRTAEPKSYLFAILLTILFSVLVNLIAGRKLKKIDMVESLKTVE